MIYMWLIVIAFAAVVATALWYSKAENDKYMLKFLSLLLWGATIMVFVDHAIGYLTEGSEFLDMSIDAVVLGFVMVLGALILWEIALLLKDPKQVIRRRPSPR